ncbi:MULTISPECIES: gluconate 2-dehydrogenase subunit 3 family protein [unclassified Imperialibacter]|uniref:gluconate 2-dehydrogenase subunit 3 family protein n=1 Tax=unclassified Imperialibacter TaxID=2629706 RepID=UPI0012594BF2|nr:MULTISPECIES: gluconate 2-dehydrogenase subunit 3 family protein [unclassified Imperialibacter]CAD5278664.1 Twin-arginine translocation pathway signal [Imperialibacter sp. 89]CAD5292806.1 Twin-arginine translocation pathway signal [Imperialibacter sp. 75]VVS99431.1 Twin-arginine translocation pathway signal [Imperialibacter sp. EC-SDR9]
MDRRTALKQAALFAGGVALLPSCSFGPERVAMALNNLQIAADQQDLLAKIVQTIIPSGEIPGADELEVYKFVLVMADDCMDKSEQGVFTSGLQKFGPFVKENFDKAFAKGDQVYKEKVLTDIMAMDDAEETANPGLKDIKSFLGTIKRYSIQGYMSSQYILTEKFPYKHVPGPFEACVSTDGLIVM